MREICYVRIMITDRMKTDAHSLGDIFRSTFERQVKALGGTNPRYYEVVEEPELRDDANKISTFTLLGTAERA